MSFGRIKDWFSASFKTRHLKEFEVERIEFQTKAIILALKIGLIALPIMTVIDVIELYKVLSPFWWKGYVSTLVVTEVLFLVIQSKIKQLAVEVSTNEGSDKLKIWIILAVMLLTFIQYFTTFVAKNYGTEFTILAFAGSYFNLSFSLNTKERIWYNIYCLAIFFLGYFTLVPSSEILLDTVIVITALTIFLFFVGHFVYTWQLTQFAHNRELVNLAQEKNLQLSGSIRNQKEVLEVLCKEMGVSIDTSDFENAESLGLQTKAILQKFADYKQELLDSTLRYQDLFMNINDGVAILTETRKVKEANNTFLEILGVPRDEMNFIDLGKIVHPEDKEHSDEYIKKLITDGFYKNYIGRIIRGDNEIRYIEANSTAIIKNGVFAGSRDIVRDITHRKLAEQEIEKARNSEKQFLANMSHEIRTPLNAIIGITHLLYDTSPNTQQTEYLDILKNSSRFLLNLITDLLDIAKMDAGKITEHPKDFDLKGLLKTIQQTFQMKVSPKGLTVDFMADSAMEQFYYADETLIYQVLFNLLGNADKFTETGHIGLKVKLLENTVEDTLFEFEVFDTGIGIPSDKMEFIFNKFTQIHDKNKVKSPGTGLGLSICKQIVEFLGGTIWAESAIGKGTKVFFTLRLKKGKTKKSEAQNTAVLVADKAQKALQQTIEGVKILLVEDNDLNRKYACTLLGKWNVDCDVALDGSEAYQKAQLKKYDIILMDIQMPIMDGYEATIKIINTENLNNSTPIIALTADALVTQREKALACGMVDIVSKPFTPVQLKEAIMKYYF
ncbi:Sensor histidine kinase RcsC [Emticicia aquatica]|uniref:histidine kinase n=1 Tax=Emticicia aquatica TaxID=1681835 RepID=A0ABN8F0A0_9BACT|nr:ATP-binding protein [Emticicia aquatica]CAH0997696.1 Sensor histidine kinase RcsC [Emticicia aquatica]